MNKAIDSSHLQLPRIAANELKARIHPRMLVMLDPKDYARWLDRDETQRLQSNCLTHRVEDDQDAQREIRIVRHSRQ